LTLAQQDIPDADKTIFVWSAGNGGAYADQGVDFSSPEVFGGMAHLLPELQTHSVAVVSVNSSGEISWFSSHCGVTQDYCLAAPGESIYSAYSQNFPINNDYEPFSGTSMAAPHVSGAIALLADYFRNQLGNTEIVNRLFVTANKSGIYGDSSIYGQGLLDLDAATKPFGQTTIVASNGRLNKHYSEMSTKLRNPGLVIGDGWLSTLKGKEIAVFDQLGAPFFKPLSFTYKNNLSSLKWITTMQSSASRKIMEVQKNISHNTNLVLGLAKNNFGEHNYTKTLWAKDLRQLKYFSVKQKTSSDGFYFFGEGLSPSIYFGQNENREKRFMRYKDYESPYLDFVNEGTFIGGGKRISDSSSILTSLFKGVPASNRIFGLKQEDTRGLLFEYKLKSDTTLLSIQSGLLEENASLLGSSFNGAFGSITDSKTYFSGFNSSFSFSNLRLLGSFFHGQTDPDLTTLGLISELGELSSSSYTLGLEINNFFVLDDSFAFNISQPLRLNKGKASFLLPIARTRYKEIKFEEFEENIDPSGREVDIELAYTSSFLGGTLFTRLGVIKDEGHVDRKRLDPFFEARWEIQIP